MPRHWDPEKLIVNKRLYNIFNKITKKLDSSVKHWNDIIYYATSCHIATFVQLWIHSRYLIS
ncbi:MAG: hypothetical protein ABS808_01715 [Wolbachia endosymbiont of Polyergus mexicanus]|uniref:Uncharacterized protein n=1 Tax=Wolbachia endosymbiont of Polyergus mexicanus TaxID=3171167 RepID=A0AAU7YLI8_9RICK